MYSTVQYIFTVRVGAILILLYILQLHVQGQVNNILLCVIVITYIPSISLFHIAFNLDIVSPIL